MPLVKTRTSKKSGDGEASASLSFSIAVPPVPASRPRVTRWGTYYSKTYKTWMEAAAQSLATLAPVKYLEGSLRVLAEHVVAKPKTTKLAHPRGDVDNFGKATLDAITKCALVWDDDDQVLSLTTTKRFALPGEEPHTKVTVWQL